MRSYSLWKYECQRQMESKFNVEWLGHCSTLLTIIVWLSQLPFFNYEHQLWLEYRHQWQIGMVISAIVLAFVSKLLGAKKYWIGLWFSIATMILFVIKGNI